MRSNPPTEGKQTPFRGLLLEDKKKKKKPDGVKHGILMNALRVAFV